MKHNLLLQRHNFSLFLTLIIFLTASSLTGMEEVHYDDLIEKIRACDKEYTSISSQAKRVFKKTYTTQQLWLFKESKRWEYTYHPDLDQIIKEKYKRNCALPKTTETFYLKFYKPWQPKNLKKHKPNSKEINEMHALTKHLNSSKQSNKNW